MDNEDVGNVTTYNLPMTLPENTQIFVTITPYNTAGDALSCSEESYTTETIPTAPDCTMLSSPSAGTEDVSIATDLTWNAVPNATGYRLSVRDGASATNNILNSFDVGNVTTYDLTNNLPPNNDIYVLIVPYNDTGEAMGCMEEFFVTSDIMTTPPGCTNLSFPLNLSVDVPTNTDLRWNVVPQASGYRLTVGTASGLGDIISNEDVGNVTSYDLLNDLPENTEVFVFIQPYNDNGDAEFCEEERFITGMVSEDLPLCTTLSNPENKASEVPIDTDVTWRAVGDISGYILNIGTIAGANDILNEDVGLTTSHALGQNLPYGQEIFVTIIPYNESNQAEACESQSFTTVGETEEVESLFGFSPDGDGNNDFWTINGIQEYPNNTVMIYNRWEDMVFKIDGYDNNSNVFRGEANQLLGLGADQLPEGTYFFQISIPENHNLKTTQGYLVLKR